MRQLTLGGQTLVAVALGCWSMAAWATETGYPGNSFQGW